MLKKNSFQVDFEVFLANNFINYEILSHENTCFLVEKILIINLINISVNSENKINSILNNITINSKLIKNTDLIINSTKKINLSEDVWRTKKEICASRILAILGKSIRIPARLTKVRRIDKAILDDFLSKNHLQDTTNAKLKYGLFLPKQYFRILNPLDFDYNLGNKDELLVAVASFSSARKFIRENEIFRSFELIRFANLLHHTVIGGLDKLLKNFIKEQNPDDIMTYADCDWSDGKSYEKLGFTRLEKTLPQEFLVNLHTFERKNLSKIFENFISEEFIKIQNSGSIKFLLTLKK